MRGHVTGYAWGIYQYPHPTAEGVGGGDWSCAILRRQRLDFKELDTLRILSSGGPLLAPRNWRLL